MIGRSVAQLLPQCRCGLRVRFTGPLKDRAREVAEEEKLAPAIAERRVRDYDYEVRARIQTLLGVDIDDSVNFNLVLNTFAMPIEMSVWVLAGLAGEIDRVARAKIGAEYVTRRSPPKSVRP